MFILTTLSSPCSDWMGLKMSEYGSVYIPSSSSVEMLRSLQPDFKVELFWTWLCMCLGEKWRNELSAASSTLTSSECTEEESHWTGLAEVREVEGGWKVTYKSSACSWIGSVDGIGGRMRCWMGTRSLYLSDKVSRVLFLKFDENYHSLTYKNLYFFFFLMKLQKPHQLSQLQRLVRRKKFFFLH